MYEEEKREERDKCGIIFKYRLFEEYKKKEKMFQVCEMTIYGINRDRDSSDI